MAPQLQERFMRYTWMIGMLAAVTAVPALASEYFVSPGGSDKNKGTLTAPFKTLQQACTACRSGDTITLRAGSYRGGAVLSDKSSIMLRAAAGETAMVEGPKGSNADALQFYRVNGLTLDRVAFRGAGRNGVYGESSDNVTVRNCDFSSNGRTGFLTAYVSNVTITDSVASFNKDQHGIYLSDSGDNYTIIHNRLFNNGRAGLQINAVDLTTYDPANPKNDSLSTNCWVENNEVYGNCAAGASGINLAGVVNSTFLNNWIHDNTQGGGIAAFDDDAGAAFGCKGNSFRQNTITFASSYGKYAISFVNGSVGNELLSNKLVAGNGPALRTDTVDLRSDYNQFWAYGKPSIAAPLGGTAVLNGEFPSYPLAAWVGATGNDLSSAEAQP